MSKERGLVFFFGVISVILTILCIFFGVRFFREGPVQGNQNPPSIQAPFTAANMVGRYVYRNIDAVDAEGKSNPTEYSLTLYENGTFKYQLNDQYAPIGVIGNFIINNNILTLNFLFNTGSSTDIGITSGYRSFTINPDSSISGAVKAKDVANEVNVIFAKATSETDDFNLGNYLMIGVHTQTELEPPKM